MSPFDWYALAELANALGGMAAALGTALLAWAFYRLVAWIVK